MKVGVLYACVSVHHAYTVPIDPEENVGSHGTGVTAGYELLCSAGDRMQVLRKSSHLFLTLRHFSSIHT